LGALAKVLQLPPRTLARRKSGGVLTSAESERLLRLARLFEQAVTVFEGDAPAAGKWLQEPVLGLGNRTPLQLAETEIGARAVEDLLGRLEYGVYS
jgi:putative toxin-antitoxin system antitoxin component (TIGR02293 family)